MLEEKIEIKNKIYEIRGQQVMLDSDLAKLYQVETKVFLQAVKRNIKRFPDNFMFQLTNVEYNYLRSQIVTSNSKINHGGRRYMPYVFTEQGVAMLATILKSKVAVQVSINIMDAFVEMRKYISNNLIEQKYINDLVIEHDKDIKSLKSIFEEFKEKTNHIFFEGQIYDAYSKLLDIFNSAKESLIIIDSYADKIVLDMISKLSINVTLICNNSDRISNIDIDKYNKQYFNLTVIRNNTFHDRYFVIDKKILYQSGTSINNAGNKTFSINILEDDFVKESILNELEHLCEI